MSLKRWDKLSSSILFRNRWWTYRRDTVRLPAGGEGEYHYVDSFGSSLVVPVRPDGSLILLNQYRYLCDRESLEFPCGGVKEGESYDAAAARELQEEAGFVARDWKIAGEFNPYNGVTNEFCRIYIARNLSALKAASDETEEFEQWTLRPDEIEARIVSGVIWDGMTIAAWTIAKNHI
ncbi:MAG TPA: NUDIX hydrolase [Bacteroidota bacterium]|nr:NUDIX hydrolase [Bacteroidota bacterium]